MNRPPWTRWAASFAAGLRQGLGGPGVCLAIQAQLPGYAPAALPLPLPQVDRRQGRAPARTGVQA